MRKLVLFFSLSVLAVSAFSQEDSALKIFKYRIEHYRALNFSLGAESNYERLDINPNNPSASNFNGIINTLYYTIKSTDRKQVFSVTGLSSSLSTAKSEYQLGTEKNRNFQFLPIANILIRKFNARESFWEWGGGIAGQFINARNKYSFQAAMAKNDATQYEVTFTTGIGRGRLENVTDMQNALWLTRSLQKANRLSRPLSLEELNGVGKSITRGNNTRVLDARKRTQFILETVDAYLQQHNLVNNTDIKYFSNLNDILFFAFNQPRLAGTEKYIRFTPTMAGFKQTLLFADPDQKNKTMFDMYGAQLETGISVFSPANLNHQNNYGASVRIAYQSGDTRYRFLSNGIPVNASDETELKKAGINIFYQHGFYPGTRTLLNLKIQTENGYIDLDQRGNFYSDTNLTAEASYFISYRTRFNVNASAGYRKNVFYPLNNFIIEPSRIQLNARLGLDVSL